MKGLKRTNDKDLQLIIGNFLRMGVYISMGIVSVGAFIYLTEHAGETVDYATFDANRVNLKTIPAIFLAVGTFKGVAIIQFGLLMLIFTPIARVIMAVVTFFLEKDYLYVAIGLIVLAIIILSLNSGITH